MIPYKQLLLADVLQNRVFCGFDIVPDASKFTFLSRTFLQNGVYVPPAGRSIGTHLLEDLPSKSFHGLV